MKRLTKEQITKVLASANPTDLLAIKRMSQITDYIIGLEEALDIATDMIKKFPKSENKATTEYMSKVALININKALKGKK